MTRVSFINNATTWIWIWRGEVIDPVPYTKSNPPLKINFCTLHFAVCIRWSKIKSRLSNGIYWSVSLAIFEYKMTQTWSEYAKDYEFPVIFQINDWFSQTHTHKYKKMNLLLATQFSFIALFNLSQGFVFFLFCIVRSYAFVLLSRMGFSDIT